MSSKSKEKQTRRICEDCNSSKPLGEFYNGDKMFFPSGKLHLCKDCVLAIAEKNGHEGLLGLLRMLNKPLYQELYKGDTPDYVRMMNSMPQYRSVGFSESDTLREINSVNSVKKVVLKELSEEELTESEDFWGRGLNESDYIWLTNQWVDYNNRYEVESLTLESLIMEICLTRLDIRNRREKNQDVDKQLKTLDTLLTAANLKPVQETLAGSNAMQENLGLLIKKWEDTRPIQDDSEWKKKDSLGKYLKIWFTGHLMRMFDIENKDEEEYYEELNKYTVALEDIDEEPEGEDDGRI